MSDSLTQQLWDQCLDDMRDAASFIANGVVSPDRLDTTDTAREAVDYLFMTLASAYLLMARADPDFPEFKPWVNHLLDYGAPNPDATYYYAAVSGDGVYRVVGHRNTVHWVNFLTGYDFWGFAEPPGKSQTSMNIDEFAIDFDGRFEILFSRERPAGHHGNWMKLEADANYIVVRQFAYAPDEVDVRMAIERIDKVGEQYTQTRLYDSRDTEERVRRVIAHLKTSTRAWPSFPRWLKAHPTNSFNVLPLKGSGEVQGQVYYETLYELALDQAMLIEFQQPKQCSYWNIQIDDRFWRTLEFVNRHTHLNGHIDRSDSDGIVRIVVSHRDPGIANWVDACGVTAGHMLIRFQNVDAAPALNVRVMPAAEVDAHFPADTWRVTAEERNHILRERALARQLRRSW